MDATHAAVLRIVIDTATRREDVRLALSIEASLLKSNDALADLFSFFSQVKDPLPCVGLLGYSLHQPCPAK